KVVNDDRADWREAWALFPGSVAYIWHAGTKAGIVQDSLAACGFETRSQIIWAKNNFAIGRGHYHCKHEPCWYVVRKGSTASWVGDHSQTSPFSSPMTARNSRLLKNEPPKPIDTAMC
ncbi:MAG TPA: DNA methylase, partial [Xanthobacteraceae bacterium]